MKAGELRLSLASQQHLGAVQENCESVFSVVLQVVYQSS